MIFSDPRWLCGLAAIPLLALLEWNAAARTEKALLALAGPRVPNPLLAQRRPGFRRWGALLRLAALAALAVGAAGPEWGRELVRRTSTGSDVVLVLDVSASMDARDVAPSRLEEARREALAVLDRLPGSRVAVVAFAGDAIRLCPLTQDLAAAHLVLESLWTGSVSRPGTDIGRGLSVALKVLPPGRREEQAIVLWTDGEDLEQGALKALGEVVASGVRVFAVGVGTPAGDVIPVLDDQGRATDIKRDEQGNAVRSRLDEGLLRNIARRTRGAYFSASRPGGELPRLLSSLGSLARSGRGVRLVERPVSRFPLFAAIAALLLAVDLVRVKRRLQGEEPEAGEVPDMAAKRKKDRKRENRGGADRARLGAAAAALALGVLALGSGTARAQSAWAKGDAAFRAGRFAEAETLYAERARHNAPPALKANLATARALNGKSDKALEELAKLANGSDAVAGVARYNLGTVHAKRQEYEEALAALRRALERDPADEDARWNYEVALRKLQEKQGQPPPKKGAPQNPKPEPSSSKPQSGAGQPKPQAGSQPPPQSPNGPAGQTPQGGSEGMTRERANQILNALQDLARSEEQRQRKVRVMRERRGKDW